MLIEFVNGGRDASAAWVAHVGDDLIDTGLIMHQGCPHLRHESQDVAVELHQGDAHRRNEGAGARLHTSAGTRAHMCMCAPGRAGVCGRAAPCAGAR